MIPAQVEQTFLSVIDWSSFCGRWRNESWFYEQLSQGMENPSLSSMLGCLSVKITWINWITTVFTRTGYSWHQICGGIVAMPEGNNFFNSVQALCSENTNSVLPSVYSHQNSKNPESWLGLTAMSIEKTQMQLHTVRIIFFYFQFFAIINNSN